MRWEVHCTYRSTHTHTHTRTISLTWTIWGASALFGPDLDPLQKKAGTKKQGCRLEMDMKVKPPKRQTRSSREPEPRALSPNVFSKPNRLQQPPQARFAGTRGGLPVREKGPGSWRRGSGCLVWLGLGSWFGGLVWGLTFGLGVWGCCWDWVRGAGVGLGGGLGNRKATRAGRWISPTRKTKTALAMCGHDSAMCHFPSLHGEATPLHGQLRDLDKEMFPSHLGCYGVCLYGWVG